MSPIFGHGGLSLDGLHRLAHVTRHWPGGSVSIHPSALKNGGPAHDGAVLEVITIPREGDREGLAIHAMAMRAEYRRLLPGV